MEKLYKGGIALEITIAIKKKILVVSLSGELDHHTAKEVKNLIEEVIKNRNVRNLIFDFTNLTFMDSSGIGVVVGRYKLIRSMGGKLAIAGAQKNVNKLLYMSGINKIIETYDCVDSAVKELQEEIS